MSIRVTNSVAIRADSIHYVSDLLVNGAVIAALLLWRQFGWALADPIFAACVGLYILYTAWRIARGSLDLLMDRELPDAARQRIREIALANPVVRELHDLRTRSSGQATFIQFHLELDGAMALTQRACRVGRGRGCHSDRVSGRGDHDPRGSRRGAGATREFA